MVFHSSKIIASFYYILLIVLISIVCSENIGRVSNSTLTALQDLYLSADGPNWRWNQPSLKWNISDSYPCNPNLTWEGLECECSTDFLECEVVGISLDSHALSGPLPLTIGNLIQLKLLTLSNNYITGDLQWISGSLRSLEAFDLSNNFLTGSLPSAIAELSRLKTFNLYKNSISDSLSGPLLHLYGLEVLDLSFNHIRGSLPSNISLLSNISSLSLYHCDMTGTLPAALFNLTQLSSLSLGYNSFRGPLPPLLVNLQQLQVLNLMDNRLTGPIPDEMLHLRQLIEVQLEDNLFTGQLPHYLDSIYEDNMTPSPGDEQVPWPELQIFALRSNHFVGEFPHFLCSCSKLSFVALGFNSFTGTIPTCVFDLDQLIYLSLENNYFMGSIAQNISAELTILHGLLMSHNSFTGTIPPSLFLLSHLQELELGGNHFHGTLSASIANLTDMIQLGLNDNGFSGTIPKTLSSLVHLYRLDISGNMLSGALDTLVDPDRQHALEVLIVGDNVFGSFLPTNLFLLPNLRVFSSYANCLENFIPEEVCGAVSLTTLVLDGLQTASRCRNTVLPFRPTYMLTELYPNSIPDCLFSMPKLATLHASGLGMIGSLPQNISLSASLVDLSLSHNRLRGAIPLIFQLQPWTNLDLSFNFLDGNLDYDLLTLLNGTHTELMNSSRWSLEVNKLSGRIPPVLFEMKNIAVLEGNLFACNYDRSNLPSSDPSIGVYDCGSNSFDVAYFIWAGLISICLLVGIGIVGVIGCQQLSQCEEMMNPHLHPDSDCCTLLAWMEKLRARIYRDSVQMCVLSNKGSQLYSAVPKVLVQEVGVMAERFDEICRLVYAIVFYLIVALVPAFTMISVSHGTYIHQYTWTPSMAFVQGEAPLYVELPVLLFFLVAISVYLSKKSTIIAQLLTSSQGKISPVDQGDSTRTTTTVSAASEPEATRQEKTTWATTVYVLVFILNFLLVGGVNSLFAYVTVTGSAGEVAAMQIFLALFGLFWNSSRVQWLAAEGASLLSGTPSLAVLKLRPNLTQEQLVQIRTEELHQERAALQLQIWIALCNTVVIPCIVTAAISANCFYYVLVESNAVITEFDYQVCEARNLDNELECILWETRTQSAHYDPPFAYSYQCSSDLLTYYAPSLMFTCIVDGFLLPATQLFVANHFRSLEEQLASSGSKGNVYERFTLWLSKTYILPEILSSNNTMDSKTEYGGEAFIPAQDLLISCTSYLSILLTFGVVFPPLGVAISVTLVTTIYYQRYLVGQFLSSLLTKAKILAIKGFNGNEEEYFESVFYVLIKELQHFPSILQDVKWLVIGAASWFYALFLSDTLGYSVGTMSSLWIMALMISFPFILYFCEKYLLRT